MQKQNKAITGKIGTRKREGERKNQVSDINQSKEEGFKEKISNLWVLAGGTELDHDSLIRYSQATGSHFKPVYYTFFLSKLAEKANCLIPGSQLPRLHATLSKLLQFLQQDFLDVFLPSPHIPIML